MVDDALMARFQQEIADVHALVTGIPLEMAACYQGDRGTKTTMTQGFMLRGSTGTSIPVTAGSEVPTNRGQMEAGKQGNDLSCLQETEEA
jgi:hypothetical protein